MNKRIRRKRLNKLLDMNYETPYTLSGMKKLAKEWIYRFPYKGRYTGRGLGTVYYYKSIGAVPVYTQRPKFRKRRTLVEVPLAVTASACCIWRILAVRDAHARFLQRKKEKEHG